MPLQLVWGENDMLAFPSIEARAALVRQVRPDVIVDMIPRAGHWAPYECAEEFNTILIDFIAQAGRRAAGAASKHSRKEAQR
jgi:pimeloyl-ACP methyl ester carboxylesterase